MATSNPGPGISANPNEMQLRSTYDINGKLLQILGPGQTVAYDPANVAITGGMVGGVPVAVVGAIKTPRQVATRASLCGSFNGVNKQSMSRSAHWMRSSITSLKLVYSNWRADYTLGEVGSGGPATFTAAIEFPVGVFTQVTFNGGQTTVTVADLANAVSDDTAIVIPKNSKFFVRTYYASAQGILYIGKAASTIHGEAFDFSVTVSDRTMGGAIVDAGAGIVTPVAIIGLSSAPAPYLLGDSRVFGQSDVYTNSAFNDVGIHARSIGPFMGYINGGIVSESAYRLSLTSASCTRRVALALAYCTHVLCDLGVNDVNLQARTGAQAYADLQTVWGYFGTMPILHSTVTPVSSSTDSWATTVNQTTSASNPQRVILNNSLRGSALVSGIIEMADVVETSRDSGIWQAPGYTADGLHELQPACIAIANSGRLTPGRLTW